MRSHDQHLDLALKSCKEKPSSREKSNESLARSSWPKVTIFHDKMPHGQSDERILPPDFSECSTNISANDSNVLTCDIELFCENDRVNHVMLKERTTCTQISSSTETEEESIDVCPTCKDCVECQLQNRIAKMRKAEDLMNKQDQKHFDYYETEANETAPMSSTITSIDCEAPILVDLTNEETKVTWKQTILKRFVDDKSSEMSESRIMIADSSSRLQRSGTGGSLATALRDRGPCVIPVQPNRSLPIRPAPPTPTRSAASIVMSKKTRSPILKLSKPVNVVEVQSEKSLSDTLTDELSFPSGQQDEKSDDMMLTSELIDQTKYILPDMANVVQITQEVNSVKRKSSEDRGKEYKKKITKDAKKRRKSLEIDAICDERVENILKEYSRVCVGNLADKGDRSSQHVMLGLWDDKRSSVVVSTTEPEMEKTKEICNKVVPPLRLKKVVPEASTTNEYRNVEVNAESGNELNYRIVTGATPRPESSSEYSLWSNMSAEKDVDKPFLRDKSRQFSPKSDGYKIQYRRNRLRRKLVELRWKALELSHEIAVHNNDNDTDTSPQRAFRNTRLRQMMNCYEKQIENISKLLCKLSASIPPTSTDDVVDLDYENELNEERTVEKAAVDSDSVTAQMVNEVSVAKQPTSISVSPSPSPGPPKLSPRSPIDYEKSKSPDKMRDSPPVLPRVYIVIQPTTPECMKQNLVTANSWHESGDGSSDSSVEKEVKILDDTDQTIIRSDVTTEPAVTPVSSSEFENLGNDTAEWNTENTLPKLSPTLKNPEIEEKIEEVTKTFEDINESECSTPSICSNDFPGTTMNIEIDRGNTRDTKDAAVQGCPDEIATQVAEAQAMNKQVAQEEQEKKQEQSSSSEVLSTSNPILEEAKKSTKHYDSEKKINDKDRTVASTSTTTQEAPTIVGRPQVSASNMTNILQLQSNYYGPSMARDNTVFTGVVQDATNTQKVTSSVTQSVPINPTISLVFCQSGSTVSSSNQQCVVLPNSCNSDVAPENAGQRNEGNRIMTEQFPTLGNWVTRLSKKQVTKSKYKLKSGVTLPTTSTAEVARNSTVTQVPGLEAQKVRASMPSNATRSNIVNVAPQWNTERWQRQQRQQQLYDAASSAAPAVRPRICPPISVTQFYPPNYAIDPYGNGTAFGYHTMCPYGDYSYHPRLHTAAPPAISGYQIPLQDSSPIRQMQNTEKRFHLQEVTRHFADILKYPASLSTTGNYQRTATGLDFDRLRPAAAVTQNGSTASAACLPQLLLPPPPPLPATAQQTSRTAPLADYSSNTNQCGRNRIIPDVVAAAAAAAAAVAAASFGQQRGPLPPYGRTDAEIVSGGIGGMIDNESTQLIMNRTANRERLSEQVQSVASGVGVNSRLNNNSYHQLQNLILDRLPYVKTDDAYSQRAIFNDNRQEMMASSVSSSTYKSNAMSAFNALISREAARKESRNCDTPHLGKVNRTLETTNNLKCSNCGMTGSMFKCLGCETTFYCDERCQIRHWGIHVEKCPKRMPKLKKLI
ncbi:uncharacterized protein LOC116850143 isoform X2 [Odontomachus brunneus]|uniref:uncharacterized protein LOC116850143 isoform X2 n=1 Tax=Odontomachus brunneus TaxID=486640 RepID=UPI0013F28068|nr:uncharacterized protein LOC116850143 isoform X2 [Odontomachus brunneus]